MSEISVSHEIAGDTLRGWALDEQLRSSVMSNLGLASAARRVADRYLAGDSIDDAIATVRAGSVRKHLGSIEYTGESVRDETLANSETDVFVELIGAVGANSIPSTVSFDLTHVGSAIDFELGLSNARRMATAAQSSGVQLMVSAESSGRTDLVLDSWDALSREFPNIGITLQARLHRTADDLEHALARRGVIRLVKGAFLEPVDRALGRNSRLLLPTYVRLASRIIESRRHLALATHDEHLVSALVEQHGDALKAPEVEFEMLLGLGTTLLDRLRHEGYRTREYVVFGGDWWLYVLNRLAEHPERVITAIADLNPTPR